MAFTSIEQVPERVIRLVRHLNANLSQELRHPQSSAFRLNEALLAVGGMASRREPVDSLYRTILSLTEV